MSKIRFSWYINKGTNPVVYNNKNGFGTAIATPPTIEMQIVQTGLNFSLSDFDSTNGGTNRATLYLVPTDSGGTNSISSNDVIKSNNRYQTNTPRKINCNGDSEFYCNVDIELPPPVGGGARANDTFLISVSIPYRDPDTDFELTLICNDGSGCGGSRASDISGGSPNVIAIKNTQVAIEATGRANDLVRRVETRLETSDTSFGMGTQSPYYALEILGDGTVTKDMTVTYENRSGPFYF